MTDGMNRRRFLKILGVTGGGAAALSGCGIGPEPTQKLIPYLVAPDDQIPGVATWYATTCRECAAGCGLRARVREGRVVKLEGNPDSPINRGRLCARGQAGLQGLYNPDRITSPQVQGAFTRAHAFAAGSNSSMAKYVYVGPRLSLTGMSADEWIDAFPGADGLLALSMAQVILSRRLVTPPADAARLLADMGALEPSAVEALVGVDAKTIERLAREFAASGAGLAVAGGMAAQYGGSRSGVAAVQLLNYVVGAVGKTVRFGPDVPQEAAGSYRDLVTLRDQMAAGKVAVLLAHGTNPAHADAAFAQALGKVPFKVSFSSYPDETASAADLVLPDLHPLEQWNDSRPRAGIYALQQPVMAPVFPGTMHAGDVILRAAGRPGTFKDYLQAAWRDVHRRHGAGQSFEDFWTAALARGGVYTEVPSRPVRLGPDARQAMFGAAPDWDEGDATAVVFPHPALHDGRGANKPWLQELPDPVSKITWHGWAEVHPETAKKWGVVSGDVVLLKSAAGEVRAPVWITPSVLPRVVSVPTGQGNVAYGLYAAGRWSNVFYLMLGPSTHP